MLGEQAVAVAVAEQALEQGARLVAAAQRGQRIDIPEGADEEGVLRLAEVVVLDVAEDEVAALQVLLDGRDRAGEARVVGARKSTSASSSRLASSASPSKVETKLPRRSLQRAR